jgi:hypothetical protein
VGGVGKKLGLGEGKKGGYDARVKEAQKKEDEFAKLLGQVPDDDIRVMAKKAGVEDVEKEIRGAKEEKTRAAEDFVEKKKQASTKITTAEKELADLEKSGASKRDTDLKKEEIAILTKQKDALGAADIEDRKKRAEDIAKLEKDLLKSKDEHEQEKNRRILGSSFIPKETAEAIGHGDDRIKIEKEKIDRAVENYIGATTDAERASLEQAAHIAQETINKIKDEQRKMKNDAKVGGYAGVIENYSKKGFTPLKWAYNTATGTNKRMDRDVAEKLRKEYSKKIKGESAKEKSKAGGSDSPKAGGESDTNA